MMKNNTPSIESTDYSNIVNSMYKFRRFSHNGKDPMNIFDQPGQMFFKILFHFDMGDDANGLLGITNMDFNENRDVSFKNIIDQSSGVESYRKEKTGEPVDGQTYLANTAFHYLLRNNELTRANMLIDFVRLLSEINSDYPWYWQSVSGLESLLERKIYSKEVKLEDESSKITIKCLEDAYDNRIGTLLDLYKAICYDYLNKREVIPANLRKFDMDICVIQTPTTSVHKITKDASLDSGPSDPKSGVKYGIPNTPDSSYTSCKMIELKNCEFSFNSNKSGYGELTNNEGFKNEYSIEISADDAYENRYNDLLGYNIGDFILFNSFVDDGKFKKSPVVTPEENIKSPIDIKVNIPDQQNLRINRFVSDAMNAASNAAISGLKQGALSAIGQAKSAANKLLGNIHGLSVDKIKNFINDPSMTMNTTISKTISDSISGSINNAMRSSYPKDMIGKRLQGYPTFEEKVAKILAKHNLGRNLVNSL